MLTAQWKVIGVCVALTVIAGAAFLGMRMTAHAQAKPGPVEITWLVPHNHPELFQRSSVLLGDELKAQTGGQMVLKEIKTPKDFGIQAGDHATMVVLDQGKVNLMSNFASHIASMHDDEYYALALPYLFDNYDSALKFLDGPGGQKLLDSLSDKTEYKALGFTMSGGFRIMASKDKALVSPADFKGLAVLHVNNAKVEHATFEALGATSIEDPALEGCNLDAALLSGVDAIETTYTNISCLIQKAPQYLKYVTETDHDMSLTVMLVTDAFWNSLTVQEQAALQKAAHDAAVVEKQDSIAIAEPRKEEIKKLGGTITTLTADQEAAFKKALQLVRSQFDPQYKWVIDLVNSSK